VTWPPLRAALVGAAVAGALLCAVSAEAVDLRGRVDTKNAYTGAIRPLANADVQLVSQGRAVMRTLTGYDGFYYFRDASPGTYQIVVNRRLRVGITVGNRQYQDIQPILFVP